VMVGFVDGHLNARQAVYLYCQSTINEDLSASLVNIFHPFPYTVIHVPEGDHRTKVIPDMLTSCLHTNGVCHGHNKGKQSAEQPGQGSSSGDPGDDTNNNNNAGRYSGGDGPPSGGSGSSSGDGPHDRPQPGGGGGGREDSDGGGGGGGGGGSGGSGGGGGGEDSDNLTWSGNFWSTVTCSEAKQPSGKLRNQIARLLNRPGVPDNSHDIQTFLTSVRIHLKVWAMLTPWYRCILTIA